MNYVKKKRGYYNPLSLRVMERMGPPQDSSLQDPTESFRSPRGSFLEAKPGSQQEDFGAEELKPMIPSGYARRGSGIRPDTSVSISIPLQLPEESNPF
jgi:hypothetical protein